MGEQGIGPQIPMVGVSVDVTESDENQEDVMAEYQRRLAELEAAEAEKAADDEEEDVTDESDEEMDSDLEEAMDTEEPDGLSEIPIEKLIEALYRERDDDKADPSEVIVMFEEVLKRDPSLAHTWLDYGDYMEKIKECGKAVEILKRAMKAVPDYIHIVRSALLSYEKAGVDVKEIKALFNKNKDNIYSQEDGHLFYTTYIYILRRKGASVDELDQVFQQGMTELEGLFGDYWDSDTTFRRNYAYFCYTKKKDSEKAYELWKSIMRGNGSKAEFWLQFVQVERAYGSIQNVRKLLYDAVNSVTDNPVAIFTYFVQFEREEGTRDQVDKALFKINTRNRQLETKLKGKKPQQSRENARKEPRQQKERPQKAGKRQILQEVEVEPKRRKESLKEEKVQVDKDGFAVPVLPVKAKSSPIREEKGNENGESSRNGQKQQAEEGGESSQGSEGTPDRTIFLSNINFSWKEFDVRKLFPNAVEIRMPMRSQTQCKGYAYVDFATKEDTEKALAQDGEHKSNGRPIHISAYQPHGKGEKAPFKFGTQREENKLFVRNVHYELTNDQLKDFFDKFAPVKSARIVTRPNGQPKGIAYVEFEAKEDAEKALKADGQKLHSRKIAVAISDPSVKKEAPNKEVTIPKTPVDPHKQMLAFKPRAARLVVEKK